MSHSPLAAPWHRGPLPDADTARGRRIAIWSRGFKGEATASAGHWYDTSCRPVLSDGGETWWAFTDGE